MQDDKMKRDANSGAVLEADIEISEKQIEIFARRLLPEIKRFFADEDMREEFDEWKKKRSENIEK